MISVNKRLIFLMTIFFGLSLSNTGLSATFCKKNDEIYIYRNNHKCNFSFSSHTNENIETNEALVTTEFQNMNMENLFNFISQVTNKIFIVDKNIDETINIIVNDMPINEFINKILDECDIYIVIKNNKYLVYKYIIKNNIIENEQNVHEKLEIKYKDGDIYIGEVKSGTMIKDGKGKYFYKFDRYGKAIDCSHEGEWKNDVKHGYGIFQCKNESLIGIHVGYWNNGLKHGFFKETSSDNSMHSEGNYSNNEMCGKWIEYVHYINNYKYDEKYKIGEKVEYQKVNNYITCD